MADPGTLEVTRRSPSGLVTTEELSQLVNYAVDRTGLVADWEKSGYLHTNHVPWVLTSVLAMEELSTRGSLVNGHKISMRFNPSSVTWDFSRREQFLDTAGGLKRFVWKDPKTGSRFAEPKVTFTCEGGSLLPVTREIEISDAGELTRHIQTYMPIGLSNYHDMFALLEEPEYTPLGRENQQVIIMNTPIYPDLVCRGWLSGDFVVTNSAENPWFLQWPMTFTITETVPDIADRLALRRVFSETLR